MKTKIIIVNSLFLLLAIIITSTFMTLSIVRQAKKDIKDYEIEENHKIEQNLKNYVDIVHETILSSYNNTKDNAMIQKQYGHRLENVIDIAESIINKNIVLVKQNKLTITEAKKLAMKEIKRIRYDEGTGYVWINDTDLPYPRMVMHPISPTLDGKVMDNPKYNCALGKNQNLFQAFVEVCLKTGEGFVDYLWPKPTKDGLTEDVQKLSYVRLIKEFNWIIGTGIYIDDVISDAKQETLEYIANMKYDKGEGYFWINDTGKPYPKMIMHPISPQLNGTVLDNSKYNCAFGEKKQNLFQAFVEVCENSEDQSGFVDYLWPKPGETDKQPKNSYVKLFEPWGWVVGTGVYIDNIEKNVTMKQKKINKQILGNVLVIAIITLLIAGISIAAIIFIISNIFKPLGSMKKVVDQISAGDLKAKIDVVTNDEIGQMSRHFNELIENFSSHLQKIGEVAGVMNKSINDLSVTAKEIATTSNQQSVAVKEIVTTMEDSNDLSKGVQSKIQEVATISNKTKEDVQQGFSFIKTNLTKVEEIKKTNLNTINGIKSLGEQIDSIWEIVNIINSIADQTKIIAFNAELEASSAGEAGKNFEIVANEIRRLADNTVSSTKEIRLKIDEIQKASDNLVLASEQGTKKISEGWELSRKLENVFEMIHNSSQTSADSSTKITSLINQQVVSFEQIFITLKQISEGIENFVISTKATTETSETLKSMADDLDKIIEKYGV